MYKIKVTFINKVFKDFSFNEHEEKERIKRKIDEERNREEKTNVGTVIQTKVDQPEEEEEEEEEESSEKEEPTRVRKHRDY